MKKVEAYVAVEIIPGPHLVEESVKDLSYGFTRNIVGWPESEKTWQHGSIAIQKVFAIRDTFAQNYLVGKETVWTVSKLSRDCTDNPETARVI